MLFRIMLYSPLPKRRDHHPALRGWLSPVASGAGSAGAGAGSFRLAPTGAAAGWASAKKLTFSRTVERRRAALSASCAVSASAEARAASD
jgi:hypothetical protein